MPNMSAFGGRAPGGGGRGMSQSKIDEERVARHYGISVDDVKRIDKRLHVWWLVLFVPVFAPLYVLHLIGVVIALIGEGGEWIADRPDRA